MKQCRYCGAPVTRGTSLMKLECEYCGQPLASGNNIFFIKTLSLIGGTGRAIGSGFQIVTSQIGRISGNSRVRSNNFISYKFQNANQRLGNLFGRHGSKPLLILLILSISTIGVSVLYFWNSNNINTRI